HIHATIVPLTQDGRLSAKEVVGNKNDLKKLQDEYAKTMEEYGLKRGLNNSKARHISTKEYYRRMNEYEGMSKETHTYKITSPPTFGKDKWLQEQQDEFNRWAENERNLKAKIRSLEFDRDGLKRRLNPIKKAIPSQMIGLNALRNHQKPKISPKKSKGISF
ncbi:MAG: plasmid recombination protein, partial [Bacteroidales bacterium]